MRTTLLFTLLAIFTISFSFGKGIDIETAKKAAGNVYVMLNPAKKSASEIQVQLGRIFSDENNQPTLYVFNVNYNEGFVIISADDNAKPVAGYSFEGSFPEGKLIPHFQFWMDHYAEEIKWAAKNPQSVTSEIKQKWDEVLVSHAMAKEVMMVQPLLLTTWNQDWPYNELCPVDVDGPGDHVYVGCVALAMGQVMKYYNYPPTGQSSNTTYNWQNGGYGTLSVNFASQTYNWNNMSNRIIGNNLEIAKMLYHCAIAVNMNFAPDGSGSQTEYIATALKNYFKYSTNVTYKYKDSYTETNWKNLLKAQIDASKPMAYSGQGDGGGHAWNCDGYQDDMFHMNWGWGGAANGYFEVASMTAGGYTFSSDFGAVVDITPASGYPEGCTSTAKVISGADGTFNDGSGNQNYANNKDCRYLIQPACGEKIQLNFDAVYLSTGDSLYVYDGNSTSSPLLATYSSSNVPSSSVSLTTSNGMLLVRFTTDGSGTAEGWYASYRVTFCSGTETITAASGTVTDGSGTCDYKNNSLCTFDLYPPGVTNFNLNFTSFQLPSTDTNDYVMIYKNSMTAANLVAKYHGQNIPSQLNLEATRVYLRFKSNSDVLGNGWTVVYNATTDVPQNIANLQELILYPNPSQSNAFISFTSPVNDKIEITMTDITGKMISNNVIEASEGQNLFEVNAPETGVYLIHLQTSSGTATLKFIKQ
ncbi:MAG: hypothetical protein CVU05_07240 [Bacteroidetes bacterium HGW-Bacteroidetes-21]|nr:MAG: hypothetical protein CVU05_07240 [Bacteroidetes bacterium HGW-Bacteroidetes-21]